MYKKYVKRILDIILSLLAIIILSTLLIIISILVLIFMGRPIIFKQARPGYKNKIFNMIKFRTMTNKKDKNGNLLPDNQRLNKFGKFLRSTSLDELPELFDILFGKMSFIGPRPMLVRDMVFFDKEILKRQDVMPGLTGWAQANGRNSLTWDDRFKHDLYYVENLTLLTDIKTIFLTIKTVLSKEGIGEDGGDLSIDYGDYLLKHKRITKKEYDKKQEEANDLLNGKVSLKKEIIEVDKVNHEPFSVVTSVYKSDNPAFFDRALSSIIELQTIMPNEIVLVVDGPVSDELNSVIEKYESKYDIFKVIRLEKNGGLGNALKIAVEKAQYDLIARMDSDDVSVHSRFEEQLRYFIEYPETEIVGGNITEFIGTENNIVGKRSVPSSNEEIREYMKTRCAMNHVTVMYRKTSVQSAGGYQDWFWNEDYYLWIRMWLNGAIFANTGTVLVNVRVGEEMYQRRGGNAYFKSEKGLQDYMLKHKMIGYKTYISNVLKRFIIQKAMPNKLRGWVFRTFARNKVS